MRFSSYGVPSLMRRSHESDLVWVNMYLDEQQSYFMESQLNSRHSVAHTLHIIMHFTQI